MIVGLPKEIKDHEYRVALTPHGAASLVREGHEVLVQGEAGVGSGFRDDQYLAEGARIVYGEADIVVRVKEPLELEYSLFRPGLILFTYLHLAAEPALTQALLDSKVTGSDTGRCRPMMACCPC